MKRLLFIALGLSLALSSPAQNSASSGSLGTLTIGPYVSTSTSTLSGPPTPAVRLSVAGEYENTTPLAQDSLSFSVQLLGAGANSTVQTFFSRDARLASHTTRTFGLGTIANPGVGAYLLQATVYLYNRQYREWSTSAQRTYWLYISNPLAVELAGFSWRREPAGVRLSWRTASEKNNAYFDVERSPNGLDFVRLGTVPGHGTTSQAQVYSWLADNAAGRYYYRLHQVDVDGTAAYSPVLAVLPDGNPKLLLYPNPAQDVVQVTGASELTIYSLMGVQVLHQQVPPDGQLRLALPPGTYLVRAGQQQLRLTLF